MPISPRSRALSIVLMVAALTACSTGSSGGSAQKKSPSQPASAEQPKLTWSACPKDPTVGPDLKCASLDVPLDYQHPDGKKISIEVSRLSSADPAKRRGILLTNSGGPGGSGLGFPTTLQQLGLPKSVLDTYDIIGMDPRGVGHSSPVTCDLKPQEWLSNIPSYALNEADVVVQAKISDAVAKKCGASESASELPYITTANTARDLDSVRQALGEAKASYYGISYGTYLGAVYTSLFPDTTDRVLLDSATGPGGWDVTFSRLYGEGFEARFPDFAQYVSAHSEYGLGTTPSQVKAKYFELAGKLDKKTSVDGVTGKLFRQITFADLYHDSKLPELAKIWKTLDDGKPLPKASSGSAAESPAQAGPPDNYLASQLSVICNDSNWPTDLATYQRNVEADRHQFPMFGAAGADITPCAFWPSEPAEAPVQISDQGPSNILIVQNLRDPATPLSGAKKLQAAFGDRARMVTADQGGHLAYLYLKNSCLNDTATAFLATGIRPGADVACAADAS
jgi:pimeloyl-ACP methyl ester carboxylesterase